MNILNNLHRFDSSFFQSQIILATSATSCKTLIMNYFHAKFIHRLSDDLEKRPMVSFNEEFMRSDHNRFLAGNITLFA